MARVKGQKYPTTRRTPVPSTKRKEKEEEEEEVAPEQQQQPVKRRAGRRPRVAVLEFEKPAEAVVMVQPTTRRKGATMSTGGIVSSVKGALFVLFYIRYYCRILILS